jgi:predicted P-loop ATPase
MPPGERRYLPIRIGPKVDLELTARMRDQLWAEAVHLYQSGESWHLTPEEKALLAPVHRSPEVGRPVGGKVLEYMAGRRRVSTHEVLTGPLNKPIGQCGRVDQMRVSSIFKAAKWERRFDHSAPRPGKMTKRARGSITRQAPERASLPPAIHQANLQPTSIQRGRCAHFSSNSAQLRPFGGS